MMVMLPLLVVLALPPTPPTGPGTLKPAMPARAAAAAVAVLLVRRSCSSADGSLLARRLLVSPLSLQLMLPTPLALAPCWRHAGEPGVVLLSAAGGAATAGSAALLAPPSPGPVCWRGVAVTRRLVVASAAGTRMSVWNSGSQRASIESRRRHGGQLTP